MLKLIYSLSDKEITLKFNKKSIFWTKELGLALLISLGAHLVAFFLFRITALKPLEEIILKPGAVVSEISKTIAAPKKNLVDEYGFIQKVPVPPKNALSFMDVTACLGFPLTLEDDKLTILNKNLFSKVENKQELISFPKINLYKIIKPIEILISDSLRDRSLNLSIKPKKILLGTTETLYLKFKVEVEDRIGKIFDSKLVISSGSPKYDHYGQSILKNMQFEKLKRGFTTTGEIELLIEADCRDIYD